MAAMNKSTRSESPDTQLIVNLQKKHLLDNSQGVILSVFADKQQEIDDQSCAGEDTHTSDIVDFGSLMDENRQQEASWTRNLPSREEPTSVAIYVYEATHHLDDKQQSRRAASHRSTEKTKKQSPSYTQRPTTSTTRRMEYIMEDSQPSDANLGESDRQAISSKKIGPYEYVSREESQQRRLQKEVQPEAESDSDDGSFEREQSIRAWRKKMREDAAKELAMIVGEGS
ncbi:hypothetical protein VE03_10770 [Pseudogymnoascus sp. 23342-1-I1]|nr:hypothetical protein VE03_10770 [Pseudogymnoascus sp. 23342-1-I1]